MSNKKTYAAEDLRVASFSHRSDLCGNGGYRAELSSSEIPIPEEVARAIIAHGDNLKVKAVFEWEDEPEDAVFGSLAYLRDIGVQEELERRGAKQITMDVVKMLDGRWGSVLAFTRSDNARVERFITEDDGLIISGEGATLHVKS